MTHRLDAPLPTKALLQQLKASIIQWLVDDPNAQEYKQTFSIRPEVLASAQRLDDAIDACYNNKMLEKATMQIGR